MTRFTYSMLDQKLDCQNLFAQFFKAVQDKPARWSPILISGADCEQNTVESLSFLLGLDYDDTYIPLMIAAGLISRKVHNRWKTSVLSTNAEQWKNFINNHQLPIELSYRCHNGLKYYYVCLGSFRNERFTIMEQLSNPSLLNKWIARLSQQALSRGMGALSFDFIMKGSEEEDESDTDFNESPSNSEAESNVIDTECSSSSQTSIMDENYLNYKNIVQSHLLDSIVKDGVDASLFWSMVDPSKLASGVKRFMGAIQKQRHAEEKEGMLSIGVTEDTLEMPSDVKMTDFPSLCKHGIPFSKFSIQSLLRDIVSLSRKTGNAELLTFPSFNGRKCSLVQVPVSSNTYRFGRNAKETKWVRKAILASAGGAEELEESTAMYLLTYLGKNYEDAFAFAATKLGLLLKPKKMDAEAAAAMWQEANCPVRAQRIILRHLFNFFGRRITVPEQRIRDLEDGNLRPITNSVAIDGSDIFFWYKKIDEVIINRVKKEVQCRGTSYFINQRYNEADIVFGGDHGARRFRAVVRLIFRNTEEHDIEPYSIVMQVGNIDVAKDTRSVLEKTIAVPLNDSLKRLFGKKIVIHTLNDNDCDVTLTDELPGVQRNNNFLFFHTRTFITGDLAFFSTILGKENMATQWCTWCKLSKVQWSNPNHAVGEPWTIDKIHEVRLNVAENNLVQTAENIRGCTAAPLFDAVPVENFIVPVLHILIGIGNALIDSFLDWIEERVEVVTQPEIVMRNAVIFAEVHYNRLQNEYNRWLEVEGVLLTEKQVNKAASQFMLDETVTNNVMFFYCSIA
jgi:hypothetical protein